MEGFGWQADTKKLLATFIDGSTASANFWILLLVVTNLIPALIHLLLLVAGVFFGVVLGTDKKIVRWLDTTDNKKPMNRIDAANCADFLLSGHWERTLMIVSFWSAVVVFAIGLIGEPLRLLVEDWT